MSDVDTTTPEEGVGDFDWFKTALSGQEPAPAGGKAVKEVAEPSGEEPEDEGDQDDPPESPRDDDAPDVEGDEPEGEPETAGADEYEVDGKKVKIPAELYEQLKPALMKHADYTRKTQELAEIRKTSEAETTQARALRQQYAQGLELAAQALQLALPPVPDRALLEENPYEYMRQREARSEAEQRLQAVMNARKTAWDQEQQEGTKRAQENLREASAKLPDLIPQWRDASRAEKEKKELAQYLFNNGYSAEEVTRADDPRAISISYKAWKYDQLQAKRKQAKPVAPTVTKPGPAKNPTQDSAAVRSRTKLAKTGRIEDGMDYFRSKLYPR